jgi:hypothetical protein
MRGLVEDGIPTPEESAAMWDAAKAAEAKAAKAQPGDSVRGLVRRRGCTPVGGYLCQVPMPLNGRLQCIDFCIADIVAALNAANIKTVASCCGHGDESKSSVMLEDGRELLVRNHSPNSLLNQP